MKFKLLIFAVFFLWLVACGDKNATIEPPGAVPPISPKTVTAKPALPIIAMDSTKTLFSLAYERNIGDKVGVFEMRSDGILMHPGETKPTQVSFKLARAFQRMTISSFIAALPPEAAITEAGTVGVEFFLDGRSIGRASVDRNSSQINTFDLSNVETLSILVDNGDGKPWFDWLMLGVVELK